MTLSDMAVVDGSPNLGAAQPVGVNARARVKQSVTARDRPRTSGTSRMSRVVRVVYLDTADSWIFRESTPSVRAVFDNRYLDALGKDAGPLMLWCAAYRYFAATVALILNAALWLFIHPLRGPLTITLAAAGYLAAAHL